MAKEEKKKLTKEEKKAKRNEQKQKISDAYGKAKEISNKPIKLGTIFAVVLGVLVVVGFFVFSGNGNSSITTITNKSSLERIIGISNLSTFEAIYNGVAEVHNEENPDNIDYYVSYNARIKAGFDFEKMEISLDQGAKKIIVSLPEITLSEPEVDITTLDYIFRNNNANNSTVSQQAYKACIADATAESAKQKAIYELAAQNAENVVIALIEPFAQQIDSDYKVEVKLEG